MMVISNEIWVDIDGYDGKYQVSNFGRVKSFKYKNPRILKTYISGKGYIYIDLCKNSVYKKTGVHRLVAKAFISNPSNFPEVNHEDGEKTNNHVSNLNWKDGKGQMKHARDVLGFNQNGENSHVAKMTEKQVLEMISLYNTGEYSFAALSKKYNIHQGHLCSIYNGKFWKHLKKKSNEVSAVANG